MQALRNFSRHCLTARSNAESTGCNGLPASFYWLPRNPATSTSRGEGRREGEVRLAAISALIFTSGSASSYFGLGFRVAEESIFLIASAAALRLASLLSFAHSDRAGSATRASGPMLPNASAAWNWFEH